VARVNTCFKAMNKGRQREVDPLVRLDIVMESQGRCDGKCNIQGRQCIVVNSNSWHCSFVVVADSSI